MSECSLEKNEVRHSRVPLSQMSRSNRFPECNSKFVLNPRLVMFDFLGTLVATSIAVFSNERANKAGFMFLALFVFTSDACY